MTTRSYDLSKPDDYEDSVRFWEKLWQSIDAFARELRGWTSPWLDTSMHDGNPIFSAWSEQLRRGFRVIQHDDPATFVVWRDTFAKGQPEAVDQLVIDCSLTDEHGARARRMIAEWIRGDVHQARPPLDIELPSDMVMDNRAA
jgi:hypothetical protein